MLAKIPVIIIMIIIIIIIIIIITEINLKLGIIVIIQVNTKAAHSICNEKYEIPIETPVHSKQKRQPPSLIPFSIFIVPSLS